MKEIKLNASKARWRLIEIRNLDWIGMIKYALKEFGAWKTFWGTDIFIQGIPIIKWMIIANVLIWILVWRRPC